MAGMLSLLKAKKVMNIKYTIHKRTSARRHLSFSTNTLYIEPLSRQGETCFLNSEIPGKKIMLAQVEINKPNDILAYPVSTPPFFPPWLYTTCIIVVPFLSLLSDVQFVKSFNIGHYIYFFFRERTLECSSCGKLKISRVARICKV